MNKNMRQSGDGVLVINAPEIHRACRFPLTAHPPYVVNHVLVFETPQLLGGRGCIRINSCSI